MRSPLVVSFLCFLLTQMPLAQNTTLPLETGNNTPACNANGGVDGSPSYCLVPSGSPVALPFSTSSANQTAGAQTTTVDAFPGHVSTLAISKLMPEVGSLNWAGKVLCEYQPWFSVNPSRRKTRQ